MFNRRIDFKHRDKVIDKMMKKGLEYQLKIIKEKKNIKYIYNINGKSQC